MYLGLDMALSHTDYTLLALEVECMLDTELRWYYVGLAFHLETEVDMVTVIENLCLNEVEVDL